MARMSTRIAGAAFALVATAAGAMAQGYADDARCRQWADSQTAGLRAQADQAGANTAGSALLGAALGAGLGAAVGGGRGAAIGAASGAIVGTGAGAANAQNSEAYFQQQYAAYYNQCMASSAPRAPAPGYPPPSGTATQNLNQQELNRVQGGGYYPPPANPYYGR
jgi:hypothetical protein